ncbi:hypothetical protein CsSME_00046706 [Camellia sinensis var. sinensis]
MKKQIKFKNFNCAFLGTKQAARVMIPNRRGSIITTASVCSTIGGVASHAYTSSKHGVAGLTKNVAVELGQHGIRVNCVSPYLVATPLAKDFYKLDDEGVYGQRMLPKLLFIWEVMIPCMLVGIIL